MFTDISTVITDRPIVHYKSVSETVESWDFAKSRSRYPDVGMNLVPDFSVAWSV